MGELESVAQRPTSSGFNLPVSSLLLRAQREGERVKSTGGGNIANGIEIVTFAFQLFTPHESPGELTAEFVRDQFARFLCC